MRFLSLASSIIIILQQHHQTQFAEGTHNTSFAGLRMDDVPTFIDNMYLLRFSNRLHSDALLHFCLRTRIKKYTCRSTRDDDADASADADTADDDDRCAHCTVLDTAIVECSAKQQRACPRATYFYCGCSQLFIGMLAF